MIFCIYLTLGLIYAWGCLLLNLFIHKIYEEHLPWWSAPIAFVGDAILYPIVIPFNFVVKKILKG